MKFCQRYGPTVGRLFRVKEDYSNISCTSLIIFINSHNFSLEFSLTSSSELLNVGSSASVPLKEDFERRRTAFDEIYSSYTRQAVLDSACKHSESLFEVSNSYRLAITAF